PSPNVPASFNDLQGIAMAGTDDGWAVGTAQSFDASSVVPVVQHWDGSTWSLVRRVPRAGDYTYLTDVAARSTDDVWAVGSAFRASGWHNLAMHWDGTAWTVFEVPS